MQTQIINLPLLVVNARQISMYDCIVRAEI